jgi:hypothetical protein
MIVASEYRGANEVMPALERFKEAYLTMAKKARYRPAAPGDGVGGISLSDEQLADPVRLDKEAEKYAVAFRKQEESRNFHIGLSNFSTNRAFVYAIEAARSLAGVQDELARELLLMALAEIDAVRSKRGKKKS